MLPKSALEYHGISMTEADLTLLLEHGARRLRLQRAVVVALGTFGVTVLLAAAVTFAARLFLTPATLGNADLLLQGTVTLPLFAGVAALILAYGYHKPAPERVAMLLDRKGGSHEHLVTWLEFRMRAPGSEL